MKAIRVFLSGQVRTNWRDKVIAAFPRLSFYNPKKKRWNRYDIYNEIAELYRSDIVAILLDGREGRGTKEEMKLAEFFQKKVVIGASVDDLINEIRKCVGDVR